MQPLIVNVVFKPVKPIHNAPSFTTRIKQGSEILKIINLIPNPKEVLDHSGANGWFHSTDAAYSFAAHLCDKLEALGYTVVRDYAGEIVEA